MRAGGEDAIRFCSRALGPCDWPAGLGWAGCCSVRDRRSRTTTTRARETEILLQCWRRRKPTCLDGGGRIDEQSMTDSDSDSG